MDPSPDYIKRSPAYRLGELRGALLVFEISVISWLSAYLVQAWQHGAWWFQPDPVTPLYVLGPLVGFVLLRIVVWKLRSQTLQGIPPQRGSPVSEDRIKQLEARVEQLEAERDRLKREVTRAQDRNEERNRQMDALGMCWCSGGCSGGMRRYSEETVTADHVAFLVDNALRAHAWYVNKAGKDAGSKIPDVWDAAKLEVLKALSARAAAAEKALAEMQAKCEG